MDNPNWYLKIVRFFFLSFCRLKFDRKKNRWPRAKMTAFNGYIFIGIVKVKYNILIRESYEPCMVFDVVVLKVEWFIYS